MASSLLPGRAHGGEGAYVKEEKYRTYTSDMVIPSPLGDAPATTLRNQQPSTAHGQNYHISYEVPPSRSASVTPVFHSILSSNQIISRPSAALLRGFDDPGSPTLPKVSRKNAVLRAVYGFPTSLEAPKGESGSREHRVKHIPTILIRDGVSCILEVPRTLLSAYFQDENGFDSMINARTEQQPIDEQSEDKYESEKGPTDALNDDPTKESTHVRYTAVSCDPDEISDASIRLRQKIFRRETYLAIVITMYNENNKLFARTMNAVMENIAHLQRVRLGPNGWEKVIVCIVCDGYDHVPNHTLSFIEALGAYHRGIHWTEIRGKPVEAHIYEHTTRLWVTPDGKIRERQSDECPIQILFCLKQRNQKKINSHRWFFHVFAKILEPQFSVLIDVGTRPGRGSIWALLDELEKNISAVGACGELVALTGKWGSHLRNPLVATQNFEYKISSILDRPLESIFGYISVLPGAFSAYRYDALMREDADGDTPLKKYFKGEEKISNDIDIFKLNMYLAEDRVLCWELFSRCGTLIYVKHARAETDVPKRVSEFILQRRRWVNGSFFAGIYSIMKFRTLYHSRHTLSRKALCHIQLLYQIASVVLSWFALANYYIIFRILTQSAESKFDVHAIRSVNILMNYLYIGLLVISFILALGNRPPIVNTSYKFVLIGFAILTLYTIAAATILSYFSVKEITDGPGPSFLLHPAFLNFLIPLTATAGLYLISFALYFELLHLITSLLQYMVMTVSYTTVLNVYAFANIHDITWGTKNRPPTATEGRTPVVYRFDRNTAKGIVADRNYPSDSHRGEANIHDTNGGKRRVSADERKDQYQRYRTRILTLWTLSNLVLAGTVLSLSDVADIATSKVARIYMAAIVYSVAGIALVRFVGSLMYRLVNARETIFCLRNNSLGYHPNV